MVGNGGSQKQCQGLFQLPNYSTSNEPPAGLPFSSRPGRKTHSLSFSTALRSSSLCAREDPAERDTSALAQLAVLVNGEADACGASHFLALSLGWIVVAFGRASCHVANGRHGGQANGRDRGGRWLGRHRSDHHGRSGRRHHLRCRDGGRWGGWRLRNHHFRRRHKRRWRRQCLGRRRQILGGGGGVDLLDDLRFDRRVDLFDHRASQTADHRPDEQHVHQGHQGDANKMLGRPSLLLCVIHVNPPGGHARVMRNATIQKVRGVPIMLVAE